MVTPKQHDLAGTLLVVASAAAFSTAGLFTHLIALDTWTILFWRGLFAGLFIAGYIAWRHRAQALVSAQGIGRIGLVAAVCSALATICFINALRLTSVADVMVIGATAPFITAALAWLWTGQRESRVTLAASSVAVAGIALMFDTAAPSGRLMGCLLALGMTVLISAMMVIIRHKRQISMLPAASLSAFLCALLVLPVASPFAASTSDFVWLILFGTTQFGLGLLLMTLGTRLISATRSALIGTLDTPLAPVWVWLAFGEVPQTMTCIGGAVVMVAVAGDTLLKRAEPLADAGEIRSLSSKPVAGQRAISA